jgi:hypothetical protein
LTVEQMKLFAGLEANGFAGSDTDLGAGAWVASDAGLARADIEDPKAAQLDALAFSQGALEGLEYRVDCSFGLVALQAGALNHLVNNVLFYQDFPPSGEVPLSTLIVEIFDGIVNAGRLP